MKSFVEKVLDSWRVKKCEELGLAPNSQKMVWLIDCWKVHILAGFREWMLDLFPLIKTMFVPANCTSKLQVADVVLQRPLKHRFRQQFNTWQAQQVALQVLGKVEPKDIKLDLGVKELRGKVVGWLMTAWEELAVEEQMIRRGWEKCRLGKIHDSAFQSHAISECLTKGLLANFEPLEDREEEAAVQVACDVQIDELPLAASVAQVVSACLEDQETLAIFDRLDMEDAEQAEELDNLDEFDNIEDIEFEIIIISSSYFFS
jgi:hypothetical protein